MQGLTCVHVYRGPMRVEVQNPPPQPFSEKYQAIKALIINHFLNSFTT